MYEPEPVRTYPVEIDATQLFGSDESFEDVHRTSRNLQGVIQLLHEAASEEPAQTTSFSAYENELEIPLDIYFQKLANENLSKNRSVTPESAPEIPDLNSETGPLDSTFDIAVEGDALKEEEYLGLVKTVEDYLRPQLEKHGLNYERRKDDIWSIRLQEHG